MDFPNEQNSSIERPSDVTRAIQLLYASIAIGFVSSIFRLASEVSGAPIAFAFIPLILFFGLFAFLVFKISKGRNWARIAFLVIFLLGIPFAIPIYVQELERSFLSGSLSILIALLQLMAVYLLFRRNSNSWFKARKGSFNAI
jgi:ATP-dependent Zn protease